MVMTRRRWWWCAVVAAFLFCIGCVLFGFFQGTIAESRLGRVTTGMTVKQVEAVLDGRQTGGLIDDLGKMIDWEFADGSELTVTFGSDDLARSARVREINRFTKILRNLRDKLGF